MGNKVVKCGVSLHPVAIDTPMISHPMWHKNPKLFHIWAYLHSTSETSYGAIAKAMGSSKDAVKQNLAKLKLLGMDYGLVMFSVEQICNTGTSTKVIYRVFRTGEELTPQQEVVNREITDDVINSYVTLMSMNSNPKADKHLVKWYEEMVEGHATEVKAEMPF